MRAACCRSYLRRQILAALVRGDTPLLLLILLLLSPLASLCLSACLVVVGSLPTDDFRARLESSLEVLPTFIGHTPCVHDNILFAYTALVYRYAKPAIVLS